MRNTAVDEEHERFTERLCLLFCISIAVYAAWAYINYEIWNSEPEASCSDVGNALLSHPLLTNCTHILRCCYPHATADDCSLPFDINGYAPTTDPDGNAICKNIQYAPAFFLFGKSFTRFSVLDLGIGSIFFNIYNPLLDLCGISYSYLAVFQNDCKGSLQALASDAFEQAKEKRTKAITDGFLWPAVIIYGSLILAKVVGTLYYRCCKKNLGSSAAERNPLVTSRDLEAQAGAGGAAASAPDKPTKPIIPMAQAAASATGNPPRSAPIPSAPTKPNHLRPSDLGEVKDERHLRRERSGNPGYILPSP
jgi:hypothetical protein